MRAQMRKCEVEAQKSIGTVTAFESRISSLAVVEMSLRETQETMGSFRSLTISVWIDFGSVLEFHASFVGQARMSQCVTRVNVR